jgi:hypothetical protein
VPKKKTRISEAKTMADFRAAVVERWHEVYRASPPPSDESSRERFLPDRREPRRSLVGSGLRSTGSGLGRFLGQRPMDDDDFD